MTLRSGLILGALLALAGCNSVATPEPVGIGAGINDLQRSPCACMPIPMNIPGSVVNS